MASEFFERVAEEQNAPKPPPPPAPRLSAETRAVIAAIQNSAEDADTPTEAFQRDENQYFVGPVAQIIPAIVIPNTAPLSLPIFINKTSDQFYQVDRVQVNTNFVGRNAGWRLSSSSRGVILPKFSGDIITPLEEQYVDFLGGPFETTPQIFLRPGEIVSIEFHNHGGVFAQLGFTLWYRRYLLEYDE